MASAWKPSIGPKYVYPILRHGGARLHKPWQAELTWMTNIDPENRAGQLSCQSVTHTADKPRPKIQSN